MSNVKITMIQIFRQSGLIDNASDIYEGPEFSANVIISDLFILQYTSRPDPYSRETWSIPEGGEMCWNNPKIQDVVCKFGRIHEFVEAIEDDPGYEILMQEQELYDEMKKLRQTYRSSINEEIYWG